MGHASQGREGKTHDRRTLRGNTAKVNPFAKSSESAAVVTTSPAAPALPPRRSAGSVVDCGAHLLSRQLSRDQARMLTRAFEGGVDGIVAVTTDWERVNEVATLVKQYPGALHAAYGLHPDNIKKGLNEKALDGMLRDLRALALTPECVALFCGLDLTRDVASHHAQGKLLDAQLELAGDVGLPLLVSCVGDAADALAEKMGAWLAGDDLPAEGDAGTSDAGASGGASAPQPGDVSRPHRAWAVLGFDGDERALASFLSAGAHIALSGAVCDGTPRGESLCALASQVPLERLLLASLSPLHTPQNIADAAIRGARNEPSNLPHVLEALAGAYSAAAGGDAAVVSAEDVAVAVYRNAALFFGLAHEGRESAATSVAPAAPAAASSHVASSAAPPAPATESDASLDIGSSCEASPAAAPAPCGAVDGGPSAVAVPAAPAAVEEVYRCRSCRHVLFAAADIMPHSASGLRPSARARTAAAAAPGGAASPASAPDEVGVGKWREAKGRVVVHTDEGVCRAHLVERQPWMEPPAGEPEGSLLCPGCSTKVGQYALGGLKCSCGLLVTPAYKVPRARVDAVLLGDDTLEAALHLADLHERGLVGDEGDTGRDGDAGGGKAVREKRRKGPVSNARSNLSSFRNKDFTFTKPSSAKDVEVDESGGGGGGGGGRGK